MIAVVDQQAHNQQRRQERETRREQAAAEKEAKTAEEQQRQRQLATQRATRRQEKAEKLKVQQEDHKREQARQAKKEAEARAKLKELNLRAQRESHFLDAEYRENLAKNRTVEVLETKGDVDQEYDSVMGDEELLSLLRSDAPDVLEWLESRVEVIRLAERAAVAPAPPPPPPPKRRKPTEDDIRARKRYFIERAARDKIAEKEALLSSIREFGEALEQYEMDDDDRDRLLHEFVEELVVEDPDQTKQIQ